MDSTQLFRILRNLSFRHSFFSVKLFDCVLFHQNMYYLKTKNIFCVYFDTIIQFEEIYNWDSLQYQMKIYFDISIMFSDIFLKDSTYRQAIRPNQCSCIFMIEITIEFSDFMYFLTQFTFSLFESTLPQRYTRLKRENFIYLRRRCVYVIFIFVCQPEFSRNFIL